mgnify:CR=1 FL=1
MKQHPSMVRPALALLLGLVLLAAGCGAPAPGAGSPGSTPAPDDGLHTPPLPGDDREYSVYSYLIQDSLVMDAAGALLPKNDTSIIPLRMVGQGQNALQGIMHSRYEDNGARDQWGYPDLTYLQALYAPDGSLLADWSPYGYKAAFGDVFIRQDYFHSLMYPEDYPEGYHTALWNAKTGQELFVGTQSCATFDNGSHLLTDIYGSPLGIVDDSGKALAGFPVEQTWYSAQVWRDFIIVCSQNPYDYSENKDWESSRYFLLDQDFTVLTPPYQFISVRYAQDRSLSGGLVVGGEDGKCSLFTPRDGILYTAPDGADIDYYDEGLVIPRWGTPIAYRLDDFNGSTLADGFISLEADSSDGQPAQRFLGLREDGQILLLDRGGQVLAQREAPDGTQGVGAVGKGLYFYEVQRGDTVSRGLLDAQLREVIPMGQYDYFSLATDWENGAPEVHDLLIASNYSAAPPQIDVYGLEGNLIAGGLSQVGTFGPDRMAVIQGFSYGLMDFNGSWIARYSLFDSLIDD